MATFNSSWIGYQVAYQAVWDYWCADETPVQIAGISNVKKVFNTGNTIFAIDGNNKVWVWGYDNPGSGIAPDTADHGYYPPPNYAPVDCISKPRILPGLDGSKIASITIGGSLDVQ